jgi:membrane protease YdiL (CAAX protease family)
MVRWLKNPATGIALTALIFSLAHFEIQRFLAIFMLGLVLGCLYYWTKNLWVPIAAHFMNNGAQVLVAYANQDKLAELNKAEDVDIPIVFTIIAALLVLAIGYQFWRKSLSARSQTLDENGNVQE